MSYTDIDDPTLYFNTKLYTGTGSELAITGVGFQPDWVWSKNRQEAEGHRLFDSVRGVTKFLRSNNTDAEGTAAQTLKSFDSDGVTIGTDADMNTSSEKNVLWNWKAGTSFTNDASSTGIGTIDSTGSVNQTAGFSIVSYTGNATDNASVKHGLNTAPKMVIIKDLSDTSTWGVWHQTLTNGGYKLTLNTNSAQVDDSAFIGGSNRAIPTSSVFFLGSGGGGNGTNANIAYCFSEVKGYSKFGSYTGNGNADGSFITTGFRPAMVILKSSTSSADWELADNKRSTSGGNVIDKEVRPNSSAAETGGTDGRYIDFLSNGFKLRQAFGNWNGSGETYIYMAFAESPFTNSSGVPNNAR